MRKKTLIIFISIAITCITIASLENRSLTAMRKEYHLTSTEPLKNAPPLLAITTVVLGGFRGLISDILWMRITRLQEKGKYYELVQLSEWITKIQPRCTEIWAFHAWNMAYNISIMMDTQDDRWRWINNGIKLLRDEGMLYNSGDPQLYFELGWIYQHKIGRDFDVYNKFYKKKLFDEMTQLIGSARPDYAQIESNPLKKNLLINKYKLYPQIMKEVDAKYGPLDWRKAETHAIYWAYQGIQKAGKELSIMCERMIRQCLDKIHSQTNTPTNSQKGK